jgi:hypothetical protein
VGKNMDIVKGWVIHEGTVAPWDRDIVIARALKELILEVEALKAQVLED